jgi:hypothetical protein
MASHHGVESGAGDNVAASSGDSFLESLEAEAGLAMRPPPPTSTLEQLQAMAKGEQVVATDRAEIQRTASRKFDSAVRQRGSPTAAAAGAQGESEWGHTGGARTPQRQRQGHSTGADEEMVETAAEQAEPSAERAEGAGLAPSGGGSPGAHGAAAREKRLPAKPPDSTAAAPEPEPEPEPEPASGAPLSVAEMVRTKLVREFAGVEIGSPGGPSSTSARSYDFEGMVSFALRAPDSGALCARSADEIYRRFVEAKVEQGDLERREVEAASQVPEVQGQGQGQGQGQLEPEEGATAALHTAAGWQPGKRVYVNAGTGQVISVKMWEMMQKGWELPPWIDLPRDPDTAKPATPLQPVVAREDEAEPASVADRGRPTLVLRWGLTSGEDGADGDPLDFEFQYQRVLICQ